MLFRALGLLWDVFPLVCLLDHGDSETHASLSLLHLLFLHSRNYEIRPEAVLVKHYNATMGTQISKSEDDFSEGVTSPLFTTTRGNVQQCLFGLSGDRVSVYSTYTGT
jgi:hypothetical protein